MNLKRITRRASLRFEKRPNVSINLRKLSIFSWVFSNRREALITRPSVISRKWQNLNLRFISIFYRTFFVQEWGPSCYIVDPPNIVFNPPPPRTSFRWYISLLFDSCGICKLASFSRSIRVADASKVQSTVQVGRGSKVQSRVGDGGGGFCK